MISLSEIEARLGLKNGLNGRSVTVKTENLKAVISEMLRQFGINERLYVAMYPDVQEWVEQNKPFTPTDHFVEFGFFEGREVVEKAFSETEYLKKNPDVEKAFLDGVYQTPVEHYILFGRKEGRRW